MKKRVALMALAGALVMSPQIWAFKIQKGVFDDSDPGYRIHQAITREAVETITVTVNGSTLRFSTNAIAEIVKSNRGTDAGSGFLSAENHFDNEGFDASSRRLMNLRQSVCDRITPATPDGTRAREDLGTALHTVQDFYAHSSWVELGKPGINMDLGRAVISVPPSGSANTHLVCGTKTFLGLTVDDHEVLGREGLTGGGAVLTTGYYILSAVACGDGVPGGKVIHGYDTPNCNGLNKDYVTRPGHAQARSKAVEATRDYVNQIIQKILANGSLDDRGKFKALAALMDVKPTLGFVIDDTGSMTPVIDQVKAQVRAIVTGVRGTDHEPSEYLLQTFNDPGVPTAFKTSDADAFLSALDSVTAHGGDDCPELAMQGTLSAVNASQPGATLYFFSDASAKDSSLSGNVASAAHDKGATVNFILNGSCSPIDPGYIKIADETGGQLFFLRTIEVQKVFGLVRPQLAGEYVIILSVCGSLTPGVAREFTVPVDSTLSNLTLSVASDAVGSIAFLDPTGTALAPGQPGVQITDLSSGRIAQVQTPAPGLWRVRVTGSGHFSINASGNSPIRLYSFDFVKEGGRDADHPGFFPLSGQPSLGSNTAMARVFGPYTNAHFSLVDAMGSVLQEIALTGGSPDPAIGEFVGSFALPLGGFKIVVQGQDHNGSLYQRTFPPLFGAQAVEVLSANTNSITLVPGISSPVRFAVHNLGTTGEFHVIIATSLGTVQSVTPSFLTLAPDMTGLVEAAIIVPLGTLPGSTLSITAVASRSDNPSIHNSAVVSATVAGGNKAPMAVCQDQTVLAGSNCTASVAVDAGSFDEDGDPLTLTQSPAGPYPLGTTLVTLTVTDSLGASDTCMATVTVIGARCEKSAVLAELTSLRATISDHHDGDKLDEAIRHLTRATEADSWVDQTHLDRKHGDKVFNEESETVHKLCDLIKDRHSPISDAVLQALIDRLFLVDRMLASIAIQDAILAGASQKKIDEANKELAKGDRETGDEKCDNGINRYKSAWKHAVKAKISNVVRLTNGRVQLQILGDAGDTYTIQASGNFIDWQTIAVRTAPADGVIEFEDVNAGRFPTRFYRVLAP